SIDGVEAGLPDARSTRYCRYRELPPMVPPETVIGANAVHVASGTGVSPCRAENAAPVPDGTCAVHASVPQLTVLPASTTRDRNVPLDVYGPMRIQSTVSVPSAGVKSLMSGRNAVSMAIASDATTVPSTV